MIVGSAVVDSTANGVRRNTSRRVSTADEQHRAAKAHFLAKGNVEVHLGLFDETSAVGISRNPDNRCARCRRLADDDAPADRVRTRPHGPGHELAHDGDGRRTRPISVREWTAAQDARADRFEVIG